MSADEFLIYLVLGTVLFFVLGFGILIMWALYKAIKEE